MLKYKQNQKIMLSKHHQERFTIIISELESKRVKKIELHPKTLLKICKEMPILKQLWFNFKATEKDIINSDKRTLNLHCEYNITQRDFILLIKVLNDRKQLLEITPKQKSDLLDLIITLGGCEVIEKRIEYDESFKREHQKKQEMLDMEYAAKTKRPIQDVKHRYSWKMLMIHNYTPSNQVNVRKIESDGYEFTEETTQQRMFFRKLRR